MSLKLTPNFYQSCLKTIIDISLSLILLLLFSPLALIIAILIKLTSKGPVLFTQLRCGQNQKPFKFYKFRTMKLGSEKLQPGLISFNQADGPVFKIKNDPRFTVFGKFLAKTGFDELPQLINILKGQMSLVGPRPLPINEAQQLSPKHLRRHIAKPGITSAWVAKGPHSLSFNQWMKLDLDYLNNITLANDSKIIFKTVFYLFTLLYRRLVVLTRSKF